MRIRYAEAFSAWERRRSNASALDRHALGSREARETSRGGEVSQASARSAPSSYETGIPSTSYSHAVSAGPAESLTNLLSRLELPKDIVRQAVPARAGEGAVYVPDVAQAPIKSLSRRVRSVTGKPRPLTKQSEGILFRQGRTRMGSKLTLEDFQKAQRYRSHLLDIRHAEQFSKPLNPDIPGGLEPGHRYFNPAGHQLPRSFRESPGLDELEGLTPKELAHVSRADYEALIRNTFPDEAGVRNLPPKVAQHVRQINEGIARSFESGGHRFGGHGGALGSALASIFDATNNLTRAGALYLKGAFVPANFLGNSAFGVIEQGPWYFKNLQNAVATFSKFSPETLHRMDLEMGSGAARAIGGEGHGLLGGAVHKLANASGYLADTGPRRTAFMHEAAKAGFKTDAQVQRLFTDPQLERKLNRIQETAENAMVKFRGLSPDERAIISRAIFVYPWIKGATRYAGRLPLDRPLRADFLAHLGEQGSKDTHKQLGHLVSFLEGIVPVGKAEHGIVPVKNPTSVTPFGTGAQVAQAVEGAFSKKSVPTSERVAQFLSPAARAGIEAATGYDTFLGRSYPASEGTGDILAKNLVTGFPVSKLVRGLISPPKGGPPGNHVYVPEGGGRRGVVERFALGSLRTRHLNLPAEQKMAEEEQRAALDPIERKRLTLHEKRVEYLAAAKKVGLLPKDAQRQPHEMQRAFDLRAMRQIAYAKASKTLPSDKDGRERARFDIDNELLVRLGVINDEQAKRASAWAKTAKRRDISRVRGLIGDRYFGGALLRALTHTLNAHGADVSLN
jgi:hypothetical protein